MPLKLSEIRDMTIQELKEQLIKSRTELATLRMKFASRQLDDMSQIRKTRKEIARILTVLAQKVKEEIAKGHKIEKLVHAHEVKKVLHKETKEKPKIKKEEKKVVASKQIKEKEKVETVKKGAKLKKETKKEK